MSSASKLEIQKYTDDNRQEWDDFVNAHPEGRYSQLAGFKDVVERTFGYEPSYWMFRKKGRVVAILPSFVKRSWLQSDKLVSQPFCEYGGLLGDSLSQEDGSLVRDKLTELLVEYRMPFLEVHGGMGLPLDMERYILTEKPLHQYAVLPLTSSRDIWESRIDRMVRKAVRKAQRNGLECHQDTTEEGLEEKFYPLYLRSMKKFGTPPYPLSFFLNCRRYLPQQMKLFMVSCQGEVIAALLGFTTGKRVHITVTASDERHWDKRPNDLAHWEFIGWAADNGYQLFDFGPVRYGGQRQFKEKWGVEFFDYSYFFLSLKGQVNNVAIYSTKAKLFATLWRNLVPLPLTKVIGPWFTRQIGD